MEHVQPFDRPFPWRTAALAASVIALAAGSGLLLAHRSEGTRQAATPLRPRSRLSVVVLNGNGISGAAGTEATKLLSAGYRHAIPADAPSLDYARSLVLFRPGWQSEAQRLAHEAGISAVAPLDDRLPSADARYQLVLILGAN